MPLTRRGFIKNLATGLLVAAAPELLLPEPPRKQWFVSDNAPVPDRSVLWAIVGEQAEIQTSRDGATWRPNRPLLVGAHSVIGDEGRRSCRLIEVRINGEVLKMRGAAELDVGGALVLPPEYKVEFDYDRGIGVATVTPEARDRAQTEMAAISQAMRERFEEWVDRGWVAVERSEVRLDGELLPSDWSTTFRADDA